MSLTANVFGAPHAAAAEFGQRLVPAGDPLEGAAFEAIFEQKIKPELVKCEAERRGAVKTFLLALCAGAMLAFLEFRAWPWFFHGAQSPPIEVLGLSVGAVAVLGYLPVQKVYRQAKLGVVRSLCEPLAITYELACAEAPAFDTFLALKLLPRPTEKSFEDLFHGRRGEVEFALCDATLTQGSGKERHTVFRGQIFRLTLPRKRLSTTVVLRNSGWLNRFECPPGLKPVGLEDPKFNQAFAVFGADQVEAREILTPTFMQRLVDLEAAYAGKHLRYAFTEADLLIAMEGADRFEIGGMFSTLVDRSRVEGIARDLEQVFKLIDQLIA
jgi:hypothetical protein